MTSLKGPSAGPQLDGSPLRIAILHSRWNSAIITPLVAGTRRTLLAAGVRERNIVLASVPGAWELPIAVRQLYSASQIQASTAPVGSSTALLGAMSSAVGDLLGGSASDLRDDTDMDAEEPMTMTEGVVDTTATGVEATAVAPTSTSSSSASSAGPEKGSGKKDGLGAAAPASTAAFDAIIAIGVLIKGETMHFEYIADAVSHGLMRCQLDLAVPVVFGVLTVLNEEQAKARAGIAGPSGKEGHNHGEDWAAAAVEMGVRRKEFAMGKIA